MWSCIEKQSYRYSFLKFGSLPGLHHQLLMSNLLEKAFCRRIDTSVNDAVLLLRAGCW